MKTRKNFTTQRDGFTLTELVVVIFLLGLVAIIATSVTLMVTQAQQNYRLDAKGEAELLQLERVFKDCLKLYDKSEYLFTVEENQIAVSHSGESGGAKTELLVFEDRAIYYTDEEGNSKTVDFNSVTGITFEAYGDIVCCTASFENSNFNHKILYTLRAAETASDTSGENA